jgi:polyisoprenoid-binding protein YceI
MTTQAISKWNLDATHSEVQFKVKHLVISTVTGSFKEFSANIEKHGDSWANAAIEFSANIDSIDTNNADRDGHLKSPEFFDSAQFPQVTFKSTSFTEKSGSVFSLVGDITLKGVTKSIELSAELGGEMVDPWGNHKVGFEITGEINREEFGLTWNAVTEAGGVVVGPVVKLHGNVQFVKG